MNPDGTGQTQLRNGLEPNWSADGSKLVFNYEHDIRTMPADGSTETVVLEGGPTPEGGFQSWHTPAWSPDGTQIVTGMTDWTDTISTAWADGSGVVQQDIAFGASPAWSPTGAEIAYVSRPWENPTAQGIYAVHPDGTGVRTVWEEQREFGPWPTSDPDYSPDGSKIIFSTLFPGTNDFQIYVVPAAGGTPVRLTNDESADVDAVWSPDGKKIAFASDRDGNFEIYTMNADGTNQTRITNDPAPQVDPTWQPVPGLSYIRPKGATPHRVPLVPTYRQCTVPTQTHGPPLSVPSCPPIPESAHLTTGTPDANGAPAQMVAHVRYVALAGDPTTPADEADIQIRTRINDVRVLGTNADYAGEIEAQAIVRVTDRNNAASVPATTTDFPLPLTVQCIPTASTSVGSDCSVTTTFDTLVPGAINERQRTVFQIGETLVMDGGLDGDTATQPNTIFLRAGFWIP